MNNTSAFFLAWVSILSSQRSSSITSSSRITGTWMRLTFLLTAELAAESDELPPAT